MIKRRKRFWTHNHYTLTLRDVTLSHLVHVLVEGSRAKPPSEGLHHRPDLQLLPLKALQKFPFSSL